MKQIRYGFLPLLAVVLLAGCDRKSIPPPEPPTAERVLLMYDNIRDPDFSRDVAEAGAAVAGGALDPRERVVVFHRSYRVDGYTGARSVVYELVKDISQPSGFRREMLKVYDSGVNAALSTEVIAAVVGDIRNAIPAPHYGFAFGSHGSGWLPKNISLQARRYAATKGSTSLGSQPLPLWMVPENPLTRAFSGYGQELGVSEFIDALNEWEWDFIILDDCFMASVEALYDMRELAGYVIASPTEIMMAGFPYDRVVNAVFGDWSESGFRQVGVEYVDYYKNQGTYPHGTIAVVNMSQLDALAENVRAIRLGGVRDPDAAAAAAMQTYEKLSPHYFYDFNQYIDSWALNRSLYEQFAAQLERTVIYKGHTDYFPAAYPDNNLIPKPIDPRHYSGINAFIPTPATARLTPLWQETEWYKYIYGE